MPRLSIRLAYAPPAGALAWEKRFRRYTAYADRQYGTIRSADPARQLAARKASYEGLLLPLVVVVCVIGEVVPITLGLNIQSLSTQKRLSDTSEASTRVFERLSSGLRITRAADDAAGLAISESLRTDARVYSQGIRNFNDGISLLTIADAAIENLIGITTRIAELAEQAANGTYSASQRNAMDTEAQTLSKEFFRISRSTEFNGIGVFDGELSQLTVQGGYGSQGLISSSVGGALGTGGFGTASSYNNSRPPTDISSGDLNGDGHLDLVTSTEYDWVNVFLNRGDGTFNPQVSYSVAPGGAGDPYAVLTTDLNKDGVLDIVSAHANSPAVSILIGRGDGTFNDRYYYTTAGGYGITSGDFNGDGNVDLATADPTSALFVLLGRGDGTFGASQYYTIGAGSQSVSTGDLNRDGILDLVSADRSANSVSVLLGRGNGTFNTRVTYATGASPMSVSIGDFNADGTLDLVTADEGADSVSVLLGRGDGTFNSRVSYATGDLPQSVSTGDFNGDGNIDLVSTNRLDNTMSILLGRGDGTFNSQMTYAVGAGPNSVSTGDFNGDGVSDLATANYGDENTSVLLGTTREGINPILPFSLKTIGDARQALPMIQRKRELLSSQRGVIGALQARLNVGISNLTTRNENYQAAASRVRDTDVAEDAATAVRLRILKETGAAILSQANQIPALALTLLRS